MSIGSIIASLVFLGILILVSSLREEHSSEIPAPKGKPRYRKTPTP